MFGSFLGHNFPPSRANDFTLDLTKTGSDERSFPVQKYTPSRASSSPQRYDLVAATSDGTYPYVWNNDLVDGSFGITAKIVLDQLTPSGALVNSLEVPNSSQNGVSPTKDQMVTSFSSKSEVALNLSTDGQFVTFMGYLSPIDALDVSNSNTPAVVDPTNSRLSEQIFRVAKLSLCRG